MTPADIESVYEALADRIDAIPEAKRNLYLAKLALLLAHELKDAETAHQLIADAAEHIEA